MPFAKHRNELEVYAFDFTKKLGQGETLSSPQVKVAQRVGQDLWQDRTAEFLSGAPTISGTKVQFTLKVAASASEQVASRDYDVYVSANTSGGRIVVGTTPLDVTRTGT